MRVKKIVKFIFIFIIIIIVFLLTIVIGFEILSKGNTISIIIPKTNEKLYFTCYSDFDSGAILITKTDYFLSRYFLNKHILINEDLFYKIKNDTLNIYSMGRFIRAKHEFSKTKIIFHDLTNLEYYEYLKEYKNGNLQIIYFYSPDLLNRMLMESR